MLIKSLKLSNFRNHISYNLLLDGHSHLITATNGSGKTNILEAIHLISTTKSLKAEYDKDLININTQHCNIKIQANIDNEDTTLEMNIVKNEGQNNFSKKLVKINGTTKSLNKFSGNLLSVIFTPFDIDIITGSPAQRRKYIDMLFAQIDQNYKQELSELLKVIKQRNKLLEIIRDTGKGEDQLSYWTLKLIQHSKNIQTKRQELFDFINTKINLYISNLTEHFDKFEIIYTPSVFDENSAIKYKTIEIVSGRTIKGAQKDDFEIKFNNLNMATFGSRGQQRTSLLALKMCEIDFIEHHNKQRPILLLDDIYSELDNNHVKAIDNLIPLQQTIITSANTSSKQISITKIS